LFKQIGSPFQVHKRKWEHCTGCLLAKTRLHVVLVRGRVPCEVLFIGEAPGASEDVIGQPFIGPAGKLLDLIIEQGLDGQFDYALTNLVCCIPTAEEGKLPEPPKEAIEACSKRLAEFVALCHPKLIVSVGKLSDKWVIKMPGVAVRIKWASIVHPAAILRMDIAQRGLAIQRCVATLEDAAVDL
jgi:DNA polymerase